VTADRQTEPPESILDLLRRTTLASPSGKLRKAGVPITARAYERADAYLRKSGAVDRVEEWLASAVNTARHAGGAPRFLEARPFIVASLACAFENAPTSYTQIHHALTDPTMPRWVRRMIGLPTSKNRATDRLLDLKRQGLAVSTVSRQAGRVTATFDSSLYAVGVGQTADDLKAADEARDAEDSLMRQARADELASMLLLAAIAHMPEGVFDKWLGDVTLDATPIKIRGKYGHYMRRRVNEGGHNQEANAGIYERSPDRRDQASQPGVKVSGKRKFAYDLHLVKMIPRDPEDVFPNLTIGIRLDRPGVAPGANAFDALKWIPAAGLPTGLLVVDRGYSQNFSGNFAIPVRELGYGLVMDYGKHSLGVQAEAGGCLLVEGSWYGPCLPQHLIDATKDVRAGRITEEQYRDRIKARETYAMRLKSDVPGGLSAVHRCPARGLGRTMSCANAGTGGPISVVRAGQRRALPIVDLRPSPALPVCARSESISIRREAEHLRYIQELPYESEAWRAMYTRARNSIEGENGRLKNGDAQIDTVAHRRFRGMAKQLFAILCKVVAANLDSIRKWMNEQDLARATVQGKHARGRPREPRVLLGVESDVVSPPRRIPGRGSPPKVA